MLEGRLRNIDPRTTIFPRDTQKLYVVCGLWGYIWTCRFICSIQNSSFEIVVSLNLYECLHVEEVHEVAVNKVEGGSMCSITPVSIKTVQVKQNIVPVLVEVVFFPVHCLGHIIFFTRCIRNIICVPVDLNIASPKG